MRDGRRETGESKERSLARLVRGRREGDGDRWLGLLLPMRKSRLCALGGFQIRHPRPSRPTSRRPVQEHFIRVATLQGIFSPGTVQCGPAVLEQLKWRAGVSSAPDGRFSEVGLSCSALADLGSGKS